MTTTHEELRKLANAAIEGVDCAHYHIVEGSETTVLALLDEIGALKRDHAEEIALIDKLVLGK